MTDCLICAKHRGVGPLVGEPVWENDVLLITHRTLSADGRTVLGYLYLDSRRHVPYLADLSDAEAEVIGRSVRRLAYGMRTELNADFVFSAIAGTAIPHFHQHVFVRHPGTPDEYGWMAGDEWAGAPRGTHDDVADLCTRLRPYLADKAASGPLPKKSPTSPTPGSRKKYPPPTGRM